MPPVIACQGALEIRPSSISGRGVFALRDFAAGDAIEICPLLPLSRSAWGVDDRIDDYVVAFPSKSAPVALPLGFGALYNHADCPNAHWTVEASQLTMNITAAAHIRAGDEILISYGDQYFSSRKN